MTNEKRTAMSEEIITWNKGDKPYSSGIYIVSSPNYFGAIAAYFIKGIWTDFHGHTVPQVDAWAEFPKGD